MFSRIIFAKRYYLNFLLLLVDYSSNQRFGNDTKKKIILLFMFKYNKQKCIFCIYYILFFYKNLSKFNYGHSLCIKKYFQIMQHKLDNSPRCSGTYY